jgi:hypothetical protein
MLWSKVAQPHVDRRELRFEVGDRASEVLWGSAPLASLLACPLTQHMDRDGRRPFAVPKTITLEFSAEGREARSSLNR